MQLGQVRPPPWRKERRDEARTDATSHRAGTRVMAMEGKTVLITGASSGIGFATAIALAQMGARILLVCRDAGRGADAQAAVANVATEAAPKLLLADLSSLHDVRALADELRRNFPRIDVLINNAAGMFSERGLTIDGIERTFALNHLAPFLLTLLAIDLLKAAGRARIVNVAAESPVRTFDFGNLQGERRYGFLSAYFRSKLANIIFSNELARRLEGSTVTVNSMSPGPTKTRFGDNMTGLPALFPLITKRLFPAPEVGARTLIYLASSPEVEGVSGRFFFRQRVRQTRPVTLDRDVAARLWQISTALVGLPADILPAPQGERSVA
jgi:NAD(P)-dependent dehydrogenase (short-subunit alcohol dehydrogenase family)